MLIVDVKNEYEIRNAMITPSVRFPELYEISGDKWVWGWYTTLEPEKPSRTWWMKLLRIGREKQIEHYGWHYARTIFIAIHPTHIKIYERKDYEETK